MNQVLASFFMRLWGFRIEGDYPHDDPKKVLIVVPHTSNWDFPLGILVRNALKADISFVAKKSLFIWPFGYFFRAMGGVPVDRSKANNFVDAVVQLFDERERFTLNITPEGTRSKVKRLKTGFYHIAMKANASIYLVKFDFENKVVTFSPKFIVSDSLKDDLVRITDYFRTTKGKNPENSFNPS